MNNLPQLFRNGDAPPPCTRVNNLEAAPSLDRPLHLAVGMFDGIHLGHQAVIEAAAGNARRHDGDSAVLTFWPHPSRLFRPDDPTPQIMDPGSKQRVLSLLGVDWMIVQDFDPRFAAVPAEDFLQRLKSFLPTLDTVYVGENFRFGHQRKGSVDDLVEQGHRLHVSVFSATRVKWDGQPVSSTRIRDLLRSEPIERINPLLGYHYFMSGPLIAGRRLGRTLGFPTLNLAWNPQLGPRFGVYCARVSGPGLDRSPAVLNFGERPTVEDGSVQPVAEAHLLNQSPSLTEGAELRFDCLHFLRPERKFASMEALQTQIGEDCIAARKFFSLP